MKDETNGFVVVCPYCKGLNTVSPTIIEEARVTFVREAKTRARLKGLSREIREKVHRLFGTPDENPNDWLDLSCANTQDRHFGHHRFQVNVVTKDVRK